MDERSTTPPGQCLKCEFVQIYCQLLQLENPLHFLPNSRYVLSLHYLKIKNYPYFSFTVKTTSFSLNAGIVHTVETLGVSQKNTLSEFQIKYCKFVT